MIAAAIAAFGFVSPASAQKDAAEKAKEGGIKHWIEYYKAEQRKFPADAGGRACRSRRARRSDWARHVTAGKTKLKKDAFTAEVAEDAEEGESKKYSIAKKTCIGGYRVAGSTCNPRPLFLIAGFPPRPLR